MSVSVKTHQTSRHIEPSLFLSRLAFGITGLALVASWFLGREVLDTTVSVPPEDAVELKTLNLEPQLIGATRIDARARIPVNRWLTYEIQLLNPQGEPIAAAIKQAWHERGTWYEDGESGTWQESDLNAGLDVEAGDSAENVTLAIAVLEYTDTSGQPINQDVPIRVEIEQGAVDGRYLWPGVIGTGILAFLTGVAMKESGRKVLSKAINDSDVGDRAVMGGNNSLLKLVVTVKSDETTPKTLYVNLWIRDGNGEDLYTHTYSIYPRYVTTDVRSSQLVTYFQLPQKASYGFYVEVTPDAPIDRTELEVFDRVKTTGKVTVTRIEPEV